MIQIILFSIAIFSFETMARFNVKNNVDTVNNDDKDSTYLYVYEVGGREQRIRFFINNERYLDSYKIPRNGVIYDDPNARKLYEDYAVTTYSPHSRLAVITQRPKSIGLDDFIRSTRRGLVVNPPLILCAAKVLEQITRMSEDLNHLYDRWKIDEINIVLYLYITKSPDNDRLYKFEISPVPNIPNDLALNVQIPVAVPSGECMLTTDAEMRDAIIAAGKE